MPKALKNRCLAPVNHWGDYTGGKCWRPKNHKDEKHISRDAYEYMLREAIRKRDQ